MIGSSVHSRLEAGCPQTTMAGAGRVPLGPASPQLTEVGVQLGKTIRATKVQTLRFIRRKGIIEAGDLVAEFGYSAVHTA